MRKLLFLSLLIVSSFSCSHKEKIPAGILPPEKMQDVLWSMISAGEFLNYYVLIKDSIDKVVESTKVYGQVFQVHHITKAQFDKSYAYYREHPALMATMLDSLSKRQTPPATTPVQPTPIQRDSLRKKFRPPEVEVK
jgi:hypothetical protein